MASSLCILHWSKITLWKSLMPFQQHSFKSRFGKISNTIVQLFAIIFSPWTLMNEMNTWSEKCSSHNLFMASGLQIKSHFYVYLAGWNIEILFHFNTFISVSFQNFLMRTIQSVIEKEIFENWKTKQMKTFLCVIWMECDPCKHLHFIFVFQNSGFS